MPDHAADVLAELRRVAREELFVERELEPKDTLHGTLQLDSLSAIVIAVALEDRFRVQLQEDSVIGLATVADVVALVCRRIAEQHGDAREAS